MIPLFVVYCVDVVAIDATYVTVVWASMLSGIPSLSESKSRKSGRLSPSVFTSSHVDCGETAIAYAETDSPTGTLRVRSVTHTKSINHVCLLAERLFPQERLKSTKPLAGPDAVNQLTPIPSVNVCQLPSVVIWTSSPLVFCGSNQTSATPNTIVFEAILISTGRLNVICVSVSAVITDPPVFAATVERNTLPVLCPPAGELGTE